MILLFIWLVVSLIVLGIPCLLLGIIYRLFPTGGMHQKMWWWYDLWGRQLGWLTRYYVPKLEYQMDIIEEGPFVLVSNHYCWLDILILFATVFPKRSFVFVMKKSLMYVPMVGIISSFLGYPLVDRGRAGRKNKAVLTSGAQKAKEYNYGIVIFPEGTRKVKASEDHADYKHLLSPKWMGLDCIAKQIGSEVHLLDVSIVYEKKRPSLWDFLWGSVGNVKVDIKKDILMTENIKPWLLEHWIKKDQKMDAMLSEM